VLPLDVLVAERFEPLDRRQLKLGFCPAIRHGAVAGNCNLSVAAGQSSGLGSPSRTPWRKGDSPVCRLIGCHKASLARRLGVGPAARASDRPTCLQRTPHAHNLRRTLHEDRTEPSVPGADPATARQVARTEDPVGRSEGGRVRVLARTLGIHANTVAAAYKDLQRTGHVTLRPGVGVFVRRLRKLLSRSDGVEAAVRDALRELASGFGAAPVRAAVKRWLRAQPGRVAVVDASRFGRAARSRSGDAPRAAR
jgi:hypothetical protein